MEFTDIARSFGRPSVAALMGPLPMAAGTVFAGRSTAAYTQQSQEFQDALAKVVHSVSARFPDTPAGAKHAASEPPPAALPADYTVRRGDTLSAIVRERLLDSGSVTREEVYDGVALVAESNGITDANRIMPGQSLDLSALEGAGGPVAEERDLTAILAEIFGDGEPEHAHPPERGTVWAAVLDGHARPSSHYGYRRDPISGTRTFHDGIDLAAKSGTPILALRPGVVAYSGYRPGYGNTVVLRHEGGLETMYAHASRVLVAEGERIDAGSPIAQVGSTGRSTGPHVHFEVRKDGEPVDPMPYLEGGTRMRITQR